MKKISITGLANPIAFCDYVSTAMIDIVYVDETSQADIILLLEPHIDPSKPEDRIWLSEIMGNAFSQCREYAADIVFDHK